eukprot:749497-Hanusia_phi.AAC.3
MSKVGPPPLYSYNLLPPLLPSNHPPLGTDISQKSQNQMRLETGNEGVAASQHDGRRVGAIAIRTSNF